MVDDVVSITGPAVAVAVSLLLRKTDPFVLDTTIKNLDAISAGTGTAASASSLLPLFGANPGGDTGNDDEDRPFLETSFNKTSNNNNNNNKATTYRSPWKKDATVDANKDSSSSSEIIELEQSANEVWDAYRQLYYGHDAIGSVFVRRKGNDNGDAMMSPTKSKKGASSAGGALEALFGIQKKCNNSNDNNNGNNENNNTDTTEIARWESAHTVTIGAPNFEDNTCEYKIQSMVWCRYQPDNVGDVPVVVEKKKTIQAPSPSSPVRTKTRTAAPPKTKSPPKKLKSKTLNIARLEMFDKAANNWDKNNNNKDNKSNSNKPAVVKKPVVRIDGPPPPPIPAVVTSSAVYTKETNKVCRLLMSTSSNSKSTTPTMPIASHIQNIGTLLEKIETDFRSKLDRVDAPKCIEILQGMYRPSLSPGLKMPNSGGGGNNNGMISRLGGHATGMGVGKGLIGEIALKAKAKGLGGDSSGDGDASVNTSTTTTTKTNKAMECILAAEKKKLRDNDIAAAAATPAWKAGLKKTTSAVTSASASVSAAPPSPKRATASYASSSTSTSRSLPSSPRSAPTTTATPEFMNFRSKLKKTASVRR